MRKLIVISSFGIALFTFVSVSIGNAASLLLHPRITRRSKKEIPLFFFIVPEDPNVTDTKFKKSCDWKITEIVSWLSFHRGAIDWSFLYIYNSQRERDICVCIYIYICIYMYVCVYIYIYICVCIHGTIKKKIAQTIRRRVLLTGMGCERKMDQGSLVIR